MPGKKKNFKNRITANDVPYRSVSEAFIALNIPTSKVQRFRKALRADKERCIDWNNGVYVFKVIESIDEK